MADNIAVLDGTGTSKTLRATDNSSVFAPHSVPSSGNGVALFAAAAAAADGTSNPTVPLIGSGGLLFNGTTWDRQRGTQEGTALASASRTATTNSADFTNYNARGILLMPNVTVNPGGAQTLRIGVQAKDPVSGTYNEIALFAADTFVSYAIQNYFVYPGASELIAMAWNFVEATVLPRTWRLVVTHSAAGAWTYSVGYTYLL